MSLDPSHIAENVFATATLVIVDDMQHNVTLLRHLLRFAGATRIHGFTDPAEALRQIPELDPDLVLLDLHMPGLDGFKVMESLNGQLPAGTFLPVVVLTADLTSETRRRALDLGAKDFLTKPIDADEALLRVRNLLETRALHTQLRQHNTRLQAQLDEATERERLVAEARRRLRTQLDGILAAGGPSMLFQPISDVRSHDVVGVEALARFSGDPYRAPDKWFAEANDLGCGLELEMAAIEHATAQLAHLPDGAFLSVNASAATALSGAFGDHLRTLDTKKLVLELTEHTPVADYGHLNDVLEEHRAAGMRLAVDDTGAGYASFHHLLQLRPDIIKLDIAVTHGIDADPARRALAVALAAFSEEVGATMIAEGVETAGELAVLQELRVPWAQGFFLAEPGPLPMPV